MSATFWNMRRRKAAMKQAEKPVEKPTEKPVDTSEEKPKKGKVKKDV